MHCPSQYHTLFYHEAAEYVKMRNNSKQKRIFGMIVCSTYVDDDNFYSLLDRFIDDFKVQEAKADPFIPSIVIVPNLSVANWLNNKIAVKLGISANIRFLLLNQFINQVYLDNVAQVGLLELSAIKFIIYDYLHQCNLEDEVFKPIKSYLTANGVIDSFRVYQLATQLELIFGDYMYLRTEELLNQNVFLDNLPQWQLNIWLHVVNNSSLSSYAKKTYLDIYSYLLAVSNIKKLTNNVYLFGLSSIFPSQLTLLKKIAKFCNLIWYQPAVSLEYYHDLLDERTKEKLKRKVLKEPQISVNDLHLTDGNLLLANLGLQSREFNELITVNEVSISDLADSDTAIYSSSLLAVVQDDIRKLRRRINPSRRFSNNTDYYIDPVMQVDNYAIKINICHNRMREVQVAFNEICAILDNNPEIMLSDIVIVAPDINDYDIHIKAVFSNEYALYNNQQIKLPYTITSKKNSYNIQMTACLLKILDIDCQLSVNSVFDLLNQTVIMDNLGLDTQAVNLILTWLQDNNTHFGMDETDYDYYGYINCQIYSFKRLLNNIVLGCCIPQAVGRLEDAVVRFNGFIYDNLEYGQIALCDILIKFIDFLDNTRKLFYLPDRSYNKISLAQVAALLTNFKDSFIHKEEDSLAVDNIIADINSLELQSLVTLPVIYQIISNSYKFPDEILNFTGKLTFASISLIKNIPYKVVYILGMNYGEFPRIHNKNTLSVLHQAAAFADRNSNLEDKQLFLEILLAVQHSLYISYIGRNDSDNATIPPSVVLSLFMNVVKQSLCDETCFERYIVEQQSLHPFGNKVGYSHFWSQIATSYDLNNLHWDFNDSKQLFVNNTFDDNQVRNINYNDLLNTFYYSNNNLYNIMGIKEYKTSVGLEDIEPIGLVNRHLLKRLYKEFEHLRHTEIIDIHDQDKIYRHLYSKGLLAYEHLGKLHFGLVYDNYTKYRDCQGEITIFMDYYNKKYNIKIKDELSVNSQGELTILNDFTYAFGYVDNKVNYRLKIKGLICLLLLNVSTTKINSEHMVKLIKDKVYIKSNLNSNARYVLCLKDGVQPNIVLEQVLNFYQNSMNYPTCIVEELIDNILKTPTLSKAEFIKLVTARRYNQLNHDRIFCNNIENYFKFVPLEKMSIKQIADILAHVDTAKE